MAVLSLHHAQLPYRPAQAQAILTNVQDFIVNLWNNISAKGTR